MKIQRLRFHVCRVQKPFWSMFAVCLVTLTGAFATGLRQAALGGDEKRCDEVGVATETLTIKAENIVEVISRLPDKGRIKGLTITPGEGERPKLAGIRDLVNLESLDLANNNFDENEIRPLQALIKLRNLSLYANDIGTRGISDTISKLPMLETLDLRGTPITNAALPYIAKIRSLRSLSLGFTRIESPKLFANRSTEPLTSLAAIPGLEEIELCGLRLADEDFLSLKELKSLKRIHVRWNAEYGSARVFVELKKHLPAVPLAEHFLRRRQVDVEADEHGRIVRIGSCQGFDLKTVVEMNEGEKLHVLVVDDTKVLRFAGRFDNLRELQLKRCTLGDLALDSIASITRLEKLVLEKCQIDCSVEHWKGLSKCRDLVLIECPQTAIPASHRDALRRSIRLVEP